MRDFVLLVVAMGALKYEGQFCMIMINFLHGYTNKMYRIILILKREWDSF